MSEVLPAETGGDYSNALNALMSAYEDNPVSMEVLTKIVACYKYLRDIKKEYEYTIKTYNYCCTRSELATYYRNLGWYYLEIYKPDLKRMIWVRLMGKTVYDPDFLY